MVRLIYFFVALVGSSKPVPGFHTEPSSSSSLSSFRFSPKAGTVVCHESERPFFDMPGRQSNIAGDMVLEPTRRIYFNQKYVPPGAPVRVVTQSRASGTSPTVANPPLKGGQCFVEMGHGIQQAGAGSRSDDATRLSTYLKEAGGAIKDIGSAWQAGDWEAVTYAALDASQSMALVAKSLNRHKLYPTNDLQQAYAGVAVELRELSGLKCPVALNLQGLSLRLYQASRSSLDDSTGRHLESASRSAKRLAKMYGATSSFLPRRWQLWWHARRQNWHIDDEDD